MFLNFIKKNKLLILVIILGFFYHSIISLPSGSFYCFQNQCGIYFWGAHEHDGVWHLAISETAFKTWPPQHPVFAEEKLTGYNYFLDLVIFILSKTGIPPIVWYFKILPIFWIILVIFLTLKLSQELKKGYFFKIFFLFFVFFGSSFGYFFTLYHKKTLIGSSSSLAMQAGLTLVNLHFAYSLIFLLVLFIVLIKKTKSFKDIILIGILNFLILSLKFYGGVISLFVTFFYLFFEKIKKINLFYFIDFLKNTLVILSFSLIAIFIFYQPFGNSKNTGLVFSPFSIAHSIIEERNLFYLPKIVNARYFLYSVNPLSPRLIVIELFTAFLFLFFNLGTRFLGLVYFLIRQIRKKTNLFEKTIFLGVIFSFALSLIFIQKGIWWNTIQFSYYGLFFANFLIADFLGNLMKSKNKLLAFCSIFLIVIMTLPENYDIIRSFIPNKNTTYIPKEELEALSFLKKQPSGVIFAPFLKEENQQSYPKILGLTIDTAYVSAFTGMPTFLNDIHVLEITGVDYLQKTKTIKNKRLPKKENYYLYFIKENKEKLKREFPFFDQFSCLIFENNLVEIRKIKC